MNDIQAIQKELQQHVERISSLFINAKVTLIIRMPDIEDSNLLLSDDEVEKVVDAMQNLQNKGLRTSTSKGVFVDRELLE